jgi:large subunit ribosomal protein L25
MKSVTLEAFPRTAKKRNAVKKLRSAGRIPGVLYGRGQDASGVEIDAKAFEVLVNQATSGALLVDLACDGKNGLALIEEVQHHPLTGAFLHIDFHSVKENEAVTVSVPIESTGEAVGVAVGGGHLEHVLFRVRVRGLPKDIPDELVVDVGNLDIGHTLHVKDIEVPEGIEILANDDNPIYSVHKPRVEIEETVEEGEEGAEGEEGEEGEEGKAGEAKAEDGGDDAEKKEGK